MAHMKDCDSLQTKQIGDHMPRDANLFDETSGNSIEAYLRLKQDGGNIPPAWIDRAKLSRKRRESELASALRKESLAAIYLLRDWELAYRKECFYRGIRALMEMERKGKTRI